MESKHTSGPWDRQNKGTLGKKSARHEVVAGIVEDWKKTYPTVCKMPDLSDESYANARLIAAAPDLLAALEGLFKECAMMHRYWGEGDNTKAADEAERFARAAIAKAKGE